ncbi:MAG: ATP-binding protein, partial [SAR324 cluster bacterium]|nr:ATP-binding protein [SAR324 cluster bacterium]
MKAAEMIVLDQTLKTLKLPAILGGYKEISRQATQANAGYEQFLLTLTEREIERRQARQSQQRLKEARFPQLKPLENTDLDKWPSMNPIQIREYAQGEYIQKHENIIFIGQHGTGKTHAAIALGIEACRQGYRTFFTTAASLVNTLVESREEKTLQRFLKKIAKYHLLIIDELGYIPFSQQGAQLLFQVFSKSMTPCLADRMKMKSG